VRRPHVHAEMTAFIRRLLRVVRWRYSGLVLLVAANLAMHVSIIEQPNALMVAEVYYVNDARAVVAGEGELRPEHPPLGQLIIASGIRVLGDNPTGWRLFPVLFGAIGIVFFHLICGRLGMSPITAFVATFLFAFENLSFVQAGIAMLDVFSVTFMLAGFWLYLRGNVVPSAGMFALSTLTKLTGGLGVLAVMLHWLLSRRDRPARFVVSLSVAPLLFFLLLPLLDYLLTGELYEPFGRVREILSVSRSITFTDYANLYASRPWAWVLRPTVMPYYWDPQYVAVVSFTIGALIIPTMVCMFAIARQGNQVGLFSISWFSFAYLAWIPLSLITDRMSYVFYFYPAVGAVCLGLAWALVTLVARARREETVGRCRLVIALVVFYLVVHAALLVLLTPLCSFWVSLQMAVPPA